MNMLNQTEKGLLQEIAGISGFMPGSAFNLRANGMGVERHSTPNIQIRQKADKPGIDIIVAPGTIGEQVHIPVILTDEQTVRELVRTDRTLAERIRDFFEEFYNELTRQLAGVVYGPGNRVEAAALMNDAETVRELAELFRMALESSADLQYELLTQSGSAIEEAGTAEHKRFSAKDDRAASIKEQIRAYAEKLNGMQAVAVIESGSRPKKNGHPDRLLERQELQRYYGNTTSSVDRQGFGRIEFDQNAIAQLVKYLNSDAEFAAAKAAPAVVKRGIEIDHHMEHKGRNDIESYTFAAPVVLNGKRGNEAVVVQRTNRNKPHAVRIVMPDGSGFDLDVNERNSPDTSERLPQRATVYGPEGTVSADSIHNSQEEVNSELPDLRFSRKAGEGTGSAIEEAGTGAKDRRFSIVTLQNGSTFVKADGDKVIRGSDPNAWASQVENYILSIVNDRGRLDIPTADGSVLTITGYGTRESHTTAGELSNFNDYYDENGLFDEESARVRAQASLYIDEVVKISRDEGKRAVADRRGEHGEIAVNGWKYRNVHFMDTDGTYYQITLGVPQGVAGRQTAYGLGNVRKRKSPIDLGSSLSGAPKDGTPSVDSIRSAMEKSNTLDENSGGNLHDESLNTKDVPKFSMRTDAGEDGRAAYVSDGTDAGRGRRLSARADGEETITMEDVAAIQSIGRKSVNAFSSDEIRTAEPFARRYWRELGVKSPFFRAWFGDWRANDRMPVQLVRVAGADAPKSGRAINADTGRPISWGHTLKGETRAHGTKNALESIKGIDRIIETAVLLDTIAANQTGKSKLPGTAFMHSLYSLVDDGNGLTLYRLFAEEAVPVGGGDPFTRAYELKEIKKVATAPYGVLSVSGGLTNGAPATTYTVADLFAFVKENVPDFQPKPVHPAMLNADGTPRAVRQGVDATVEVLDGKTALQDGEAVYVKLENPYPAGTAAEVPERAALEAGGYDGAVYQDGNGGTHYAVLDGTQLKSATDNAGTFDGRNPNFRFSQKADAEWAAYVSEEAQQRYAQDGRFQRWAHRDLAFISAASWDGVHIPADVLMQNPKIREAQRLTERRGSSLDANPPGTNSLVDTRRERMAERLLNAEHGSAVFENGKIKKINGVEQFTGEVEQGRHACIVIGRPAGGKSRVFANPLSNRYKARILDADTVKPWLDGFDDGYGAGYVQDESSLIMEMAFEKAIARGDNVIIPKIGGGSIVDLANRMKSAGYTVDLYYNEVSEETSIMRAASRFAEEGRYLALDYLLTIRNKATETFTKWAESGIFNYAEWRNNDVGFGEEPRLVWRTGDGGLASVLGDAAELERTVGRNQGDAQRYRRDIPVSGGTEAGDREISGQVTGRKQIDSDTTEAPEEGAFFDALIQDTPRRYSARATTNDGAHRQSAEGEHVAPAVSETVLVAPASALAAILSILTSVAGLPEAKEE